MRLGFGVFVAVGLVSFGYSFGVLQFYLALPPCTLCTLERFVLGGLLLSSLAALILFRRGFSPFHAPFLLLNMILLLLGLYVSYQHVKLQYFPQESLSCFVSLGVHSKSVFTRFVEQLSSTTDCSAVDFVILGLSISAQVMILFFSLLCLNLLQWGLFFREWRKG